MKTHFIHQSGREFLCGIPTTPNDKWKNIPSETKIPEEITCENCLRVIKTKLLREEIASLKSKSMKKMNVARPAQTYFTHPGDEKKIRRVNVSLETLKLFYNSLAKIHKHDLEIENSICTKYTDKMDELKELIDHIEDGSAPFKVSKII